MQRKISKKTGNPGKKEAKKSARSKVVLIEFDDDELIEMTVRLLAEEGKVSTSLIQRRLKVGYSRSAKLLDRLEDLKIIAPQNGTDPRRQVDKGSIQIKRKPEAKVQLPALTNTKIGRPSIYSDNLVTLMCTRIAHGESLRQICRDEDMPDMSTFFDWMLDAKKEMLHKMYERARELQAEVLFDETLEIADDGTNDWYDREVGNGHTVRAFDHEHAHRSKLRVDTRKWYISKVLPKKYGDKLDLTTLGKKLTEPRRAVINYVVPPEPAVK